MSGAGGRVPSAGWIVGLGVVGTLTLAALLDLGTPMALLDAAYMAVLLVLMPALAVAQLGAVDEAPIARTQAYGGSIVALILLTGATLIVGTRAGGDGASVGLVSMAPGRLVGWTTGLLLGGLILVVVFRQVSRTFGVRESALTRQLIPRTTNERVIFAMLACWAGLGEELAYRGYAVLTLGTVAGSWGAVLITSGVFGVLHAYQGPFGTVRAALIAVLFGWGMLASGSLWPGIAAHALLDLIAGLMLQDWLLVPEDDDGVESDGPAFGPDDSSTTVP